MFSKVLLEGDRNMERFMIDEFRQEKEQAKLAELSHKEQVRYGDAHEIICAASPRFYFTSYFRYGFKIRL